MINFRFAIIFLAAFGVSNAQQPTSEQEIPLDIQTLCNRTTLPQPPNEQPSLGLSPIQYVNISTGTIAYRVYSPPQANTSLPAILLITGFGNSMANWPSNLIRGLADMHSQVILFDNRGQGLSTDLSPNQRISIQGMANDTAQLIQALNLSSKPDLVGYSMGGMIATALLTNYSSLIDTAVVAHGSAGGKNSTLPTREATQIAIEQNNTVAELGILFDLSVPRERSGACIHYFQDVLGSSSWAPVNSTTTQRQLGAITDYVCILCFIRCSIVTLLVLLYY